MLPEISVVIPVYNASQYISRCLDSILAPLEAIEDNYPKFILSMDYGSGENNGIKRLNVLDWLLGQV